MTNVADMVEALRIIAHREKWCKHSDMWHDVAHGEDNVDPEVREQAHHIILMLINEHDRIVIERRDHRASGGQHTNST